MNFNSIPHFSGFSFFCVFIQLLHHLKWQRGKLKTVKPYTTTEPTTTTTTARQNWTGGRKEVLKNFPTLPVSTLLVWHFIENYFERKSKSISKINCFNTESKIKLIIIQHNHAIQNYNWFCVLRWKLFVYRQIKANINKIISINTKSYIYIYIYMNYA